MATEISTTINLAPFVLLLVACWAVALATLRARSRRAATAAVADARSRSASGDVEIAIPISVLWLTGAVVLPVVVLAAIALFGS